VDYAISFSKEILPELENFIKTIVVFGSYSKYDVKKISENNWSINHDSQSDIDILIVVDDVKYALTAEFIQTYRVVVANILRKLNFKIHLQTLKLSNFWDYAKKGHPILVNILRTGYPVYDLGMFETLQYLLEDGKIKGTEEMINEFYKKSCAAMHNSSIKIINAVVDLYWACYDSSQAALMKIGEMPGLPQLIPDLLQVRFVNLNKLDGKHVHFFSHLYDITKKLEKGEIDNISGHDYENIKANAIEFQKVMKELIYKNK
jgi:predicted nucleotidyltransferase